MSSIACHLRRLGPVLTSSLLLVLVAAYRVHFQLAPRQTGEYHRRIRQAADAMPLRIGSWVGTDVPVSAGAVALLHPNVIISRQYSDVASGRSVNFLLVQCSDARDILGHYPPVCYVVHGWTPLSAKPEDWGAADASYAGMEYEYSKLRVDQSAHVVVCDFMLLPDGRSCRSMDSVEKAARAYPTRFFGATQVQLQCDAAVPAHERDEIFRTILNAAKPILDCCGAEGSSDSHE